MKYATIKAISIAKVLETYFEPLHHANVKIIIIGANNGNIKDFLTKYLSEENVTAILVEPVKDLFSELKARFEANRNIFFENSAIHRRQGKKTIYRLKKSTDFPDWCLGLGSFNKHVVLSHETEIRNLRKHLVSETVNCITFDKLIAKYQFDEINILQIDTEGYDYDIIKSINFKNARPHIIICEYLHISFYQYFDLINLFIDNNYLVNKNNGSFDLIAIDSGIF